MWSLFKKKEVNGGLDAFDISGEKLEPLKFSNGKSQADVVKEILEEIGKGEKIIFVRGVCGTGKSAIALNLAKHFKKASIVVPIKNLQDQYEQDYSNEKFIIKDNKKLKISLIKGRNNFRCPFLGERADDPELPCSIELREKNLEKIKQYIKMAGRRVEDFSSIDDVRRMSIAPACPYWSPLLPAEANVKPLEGAEKKKYSAISGKEYALYQRKKGCGYYQQYLSYVESDVLIFNSLKYVLETVMGRRPKTEIDIIDECDEFLDGFALEKKINLSRLLTSLQNLPVARESKDAVRELIFEINEVLANTPKDDIEKLCNTRMVKLTEKILANPYLAEDNEDNYYNRVFEIVKEFEPLLDESYISFSADKGAGQDTLFGKLRGENVFVTFVSINLARKFEDLLKSTKILILMSGTLHAPKVLKDVFGLKNFKVIDAETANPGTVTKFRTGHEKNCKYENFKNGYVTRKQYLQALSACVEKAKRPVLVHVSAFDDLPTQIEKQEYRLDNLIAREAFQMQNDASELDKFKTGKKDVLFTTKCSRGVDFPGEQCNSIILTKYPYPNIQGLFWKILRKEKQEQYMEFYLDKAKRELLQKIYRGVRFKGDHVILLSPDSRVLESDIR
jgi:Rad3-related DNA helicase